MDVEQLEVIASDPRDEDAVGLTSFRREAQEPGTVAENALESTGAGRTIVLEIGERHRPDRAARCVLARDDNEAVAVSDRQRSQDDRVHDTKHGRIHTDTKSERQYDSTREDGRLLQQSRRNTMSCQTVSRLFMRRAL